MKRILTTAILMLSLAVAAFAQKATPFGFSEGMTRSEVVTLIGESNVTKQDGDILYLKRAPKSNPSFDGYMVWISPTMGLVRVVGLGVFIDTGDAGTELKQQYQNVISDVSLKYGAPTKTFDSCPGTDSECNHPQFWKLNRSLATIWKLSYISIAVQAKGTRPNSGFVNFVAEFPSFAAYNAGADAY